MDQKYAGMTVNERLYVSGLIKNFDKAVKKRDIEAVVLILKKVEFTDSTIQPILEQLGLTGNSEIIH